MGRSGNGLIEDPACGQPGCIPRGGRDGHAPDLGRPGRRSGFSTFGHPSRAGSRDVSGHIKAIEGRKLTLDSGIILVLPPTLTVDRRVLAVGARVHARYEDRDGTYVVTAIGREPS